MDILINDESLDGQFITVDDFVDKELNEIISMLQLIDVKSMRLLKSQNTYRRMITTNESVSDLFRITGNPEVTKLKSVLVAKLCDEPFWEDEMVTDFDAVYLCEKMKMSIPNCITESMERKGVLLSFKHSDFLDKFIDIRKDNIDYKIKNAIQLEQLIEHLLEENKINGTEFLQKSKFNKKINFCTKNGLLDIELTNADYKKIKSNFVHMIQCLENGENCRFSKEMKDDKITYYEFRTTVSGNRELRIFYVYHEDSLYLLNAFIKKTNKTPAQELKLAKKLAENIKNN